MRSAITEVCDLKKAVESFDWKSAVDKDAVKDKLNLVALKYKKYECVKKVEKGDLVSLSMQSDNKKFNRSLKLKAGDGLFDKGLEESLIGKTADKQYTYSRDGLEVNYKINEISRLIVPEVTDQMAKDEGIEGVSTAKQLVKYFEKKDLFDRVTSEFYSAFSYQLEKSCTYNIVEDDISEMVECEMERCRAISRTMDMVFDEMTADQLAGAVGCRSIADFKKMITTSYNHSLRVALYAAAIKGEDASVLSYNNVPDYFMELRDKTVALAIEKIVG